MKSTVRILLLILITAGFTSCEKIKSLFDFDVDTTISGDLNILTDATETKSANSFGFNESITVQVLNDDLYEYEDQIKDFVVSGVTASVESISETDVIILADSKFTISNSNHTVVWTFGSDWPVSVGTSVNLEDAGVFDMVEQILDDRLPFTMTAVGTCNKGGVSAIIRLGIETTVTVNPK
jgi:hypothetical protein